MSREQPLKCVRKKAGAIMRVPAEEARRLVEQEGYVYASKIEWKRQQQTKEGATSAGGPQSHE